MAKIHSENLILNRQRLTSKAPDEELAVIENGDSRSGLAFQISVCWFPVQRYTFCSSAADWQNQPAIICVFVDPPSVVLQGSVSLWGHLREKTVLRIPQKLIYRGRGYGQVNLYNLRWRKTTLSDLLGLGLNCHHYWQQRVTWLLQLHP